MRTIRRSVALFGVALAVAACRQESARPRVQAAYDKASGKLVQLTVDAEKDGKPNIYSYMDGPKFVRVEIDWDEDGLIDQWEHYDDGRRAVRAGQPRANDGQEGISKIEISTRRDGKPNRIEFFDNGSLVRAEEDSDLDGRPDRWETYEGGALRAVAFDRDGNGAPETQIDYASLASGEAR
jgi:hypothetical protein